MKEKRLYALRLNAFQDSKIPVFSREIRKEKNRYIDAQIAYYRRNGMLSPMLEVNHFLNLDQIYRKNIKKIFIGTSRIALASMPDFKSVLPKEVKRGTIESSLGRWYANYAGAKIKAIARTTTADLRRMMKKAFDSGEPENVVIKQGLLAKGLSAFRATTIARTEIGIASSFASAETIRDMASEVGVKLYKTWIAVNDERTREDHSAVDGEMVENSGKFLVGGEYLDRPQDPSASAHNSINCRCALAWDTDF